MHFSSGSWPTTTPTFSRRRPSLFTVPFVGRQLLILLLGDATEAELETAVETRGDGYLSVYVVAPAHVKARSNGLPPTRRGRMARRAPAHSKRSGSSPARPRSAAARREAPGPGSGRRRRARALSGRRDRRGGIGRDRPTSAPRTASARPAPVSSSSGLTVRPETWRTRLRAATSGLSSGRNESTPWVAFVGANVGLLLPQQWRSQASGC